MLDRAEMERQGMGAALAVAKGSDEPPRFIVLRYTGPSDPQAAPLALVGKGITFDSGGLSLKTAEGMENMKDDMAGAAAVLGAMVAIGELRPAGNVLAVIPATENMPSGHATRPGDVVRACDGTTVEVRNTDAEGRLILADAVAWARRQGASRIVTAATLTGAVVVALGNQAAGLVATDDGLAEAVVSAAGRVGERVWRLPAYPEYREQLKSEVADIKNVGGRQAGCIVGGLFVARFAGDVPFAHLDIAGVAYVDDGWLGRGATGAGCRTLATLALASSL